MKFLRMTAILFVLLLAWVGQATAQTYVSGPIESDTTWTELNSPYVAQNDQVTVNVGKTLTIEAGVVVKFSGVGLTVHGTLIAGGTSSKPIVFTSLKDDSAGGDTNGDGGATTPARGDWYNLLFSSTSGSNVLDYVVIRYGGGSGSNCLIVETPSLTLSNSTVEESQNDGIYVSGASPTITGNAIRNNGSHGIKLEPSNATIATITNNTISGNGLEGIWAGASSTATITGNTISGNSSFPIFLEANSLNSVISGNILFGNGLNGIGLRGAISAATTWGSLNAPYVVTGLVTVSSGVTVTISAGVVAKFSDVGLRVEGTLIADGTFSQPIVFTSLNDDSFGGDTNGDGGAAIPAGGDWYNIWFTSTSLNSVLDYVVIRYGGGSGTDSLIVDTSSLTLSNITVEESRNAGIHAWASMTITGSVIRNNFHYGIILSDSNATITSSTISGNGSGGVYNSASSIIVNAQSNYWGDPSGPYDPSDDSGTGGWYNPLGKGDSVSDYVDYSSWLLIDPNLTLSGTVYVAGTSTRIPGASLSLGSYPTTTTNSNGYYAFDKILGGDYPMVVSKAGYSNYSTTINVTTSMTRDIFLPPESGTSGIVINNGATYTTTGNVTLTLSGSGISQMRFTNDGISWSAWEPYATSKPWTLTAGNGIKNVNVEFQDGAGNSSGIFSDTILLTKFIMDFDGDNKSDIAVWRPGDGYWYAISSNDGSIISEQWGAGWAPYNDVPVPGDYDGDGKTDLAVWRPGDGFWYIISSKDGSIISQQWGAGYAPYNDVPVPGDYDGDGKTDMAVWRPGIGYGFWYILKSFDGKVIQTQWGAGGLNDVPVPGDYDGDGKTDIAVWRPGNGTWYIIRSSDGEVIQTQWGSSALNDVPVPGDYDGDGKTDIAVWRPGTGYWYIISSKDGSIISRQWGAGYAPYNHVPVPGDYDGDGKTDTAIWQPGNGFWYIMNSKDWSITATQWGAGSLNDEPISQ